MSRDLCIKNKDGNLNSINCIEDGVASKQVFQLSF